jgi:dynein heavy chain
MFGTAQEAYFNILVPTVDTTRYAYMMSTIIASGRNVLFAGDTGVGKSVIINDALLRMTTGPEPKFVNATVNFSAQTQSYNLQEVLETKLDKKRKNRWGWSFACAMCLS